MTDPAKPPRYRMSPGEWFFRGDDFQISGQILEEQGAALSAPVCLAFAAECYLKCLLTLRGKPFPNDHDLYNLFKRLPLPDKQWIESEWSKYNLAHLVAIKDSAPDGLQLPTTLLQTLQFSGMTFKNFRYIERGRGGWLLGTFSPCVRELILVTRPDWEDHPPGPIDLS